MYIYSPTLYITYTHTRIGKYFFFFRAVGSGRFECLSVSALVALARRCGGEHIILRDVWHYLSIYLFIFFLSILTHAHVCAYMYACTYVCVCVYVYIYVRPWFAYYIYQCAIFATLWSGDGRFFSWFSDGWSIGWLVRGWRIRQIYGVMCDVYIMWMLSLSLCICIYGANV